MKIIALVLFFTCFWNLKANTSPIEDSISFVIDEKKEVVLIFLNKNKNMIIKVKEKESDQVQWKGYEYYLSKRRIDSITYRSDEYPFLFLSIKKEGGLKYAGNYYLRDNIAELLIKQSNKLLKIDPNILNNKSLCIREFSTNGALSTFYLFRYNICEGGIIKSIDEEIPDKEVWGKNIKQGNEVLLNEKYIKWIATYDNDELHGIHMAFKNNGKLKYFFLCKNNLRYKLYHYRDLLKLRKNRHSQKLAQ